MPSRPPLTKNDVTCRQIRRTTSPSEEISFYNKGVRGEGLGIRGWGLDLPRHQSPNSGSSLPAHFSGNSQKDSPPLHQTSVHHFSDFVGVIAWCPCPEECCSVNILLPYKHSCIFCFLTPRPSSPSRRPPTPAPARLFSFFIGFCLIPVGLASVLLIFIPSGRHSSAAARRTHTWPVRKKSGLW